MVAEQPASDQQAFEAVVLTESGRLFGVAYSILCDVQEAEDAVQDTMELAWRSRQSLRDPERQTAWLRQICVRRCLRVRRGLGRRLWLAGTLQAHGGSPEDRDLDLDRSYLRLTRRQRAVVALHYHHGYSLDECARLIGCRPGTARSHLARALSAMRKELGYE